MKKSEYKFFYYHNTEILFEFTIHENTLNDACNKAISYCKHRVETNFFFIDFHINNLYCTSGGNKMFPVIYMMNNHQKEKILKSIEHTNDILKILDMSGVTFVTYKTDYNNKKTTIGIEFEIDNDLITSKIHERIVENLKGGK